LAVAVRREQGAGRRKQLAIGSWQEKAERRKEGQAHYLYLIIHY